MDGQPLTNKAFMTVFGFTEDDLKANHDGCMTERQRARLRQLGEQVRFTLRIGFSIAGILLLLVFLFLSQSPGGLWISAGGGLLFLVVAWAVLAQFEPSQDYFHDADEGVVEAKCGNARQVTEPGGEDGPSYFILIEGRRIAVVSKEAMLLFDEHTAYRLYLTPLTSRILSVEILEGEGEV